MRPSILRHMMLAFLGFGLCMGLVFPLYAQFFVEWKPGLKLWFAIGCIVAGLTIGLANYWLVNLILLRKLRRIAAVANAISNKDVSRRCTMESHDVIGEIVDSFNAMTETLTTMVRRITDTAARLSNEAANLSQAVHHGHEQVRRQQHDTEDTADAMDEMTRRIQDVTRSAGEAASAAQQADQEADSGRRIVSRTITGVDELAGEVEHAAETVKALAQDSDNIGTVLSVIQSVAEQTNLLALNAAIEAARAGEQGRGFAVVADEVRALATRTQHSVEEIRTLVARLRQSGQEAVAALEANRAKARAGSEGAGQAARALDAIASAIGRISSMNEHIAGLAAEQADFANQVNRSVGEIRQVASDSVSGAEALSATGSQVAAMAEDLRAYVSQFRTRAD